MDRVNQEMVNGISDIQRLVNDLDNKIGTDLNLKFQPW